MYYRHHHQPEHRPLHRASPHFPFGAPVPGVTPSCSITPLSSVAPALTAAQSPPAALTSRPPPPQATDDPPVPPVVSLVPPAVTYQNRTSNEVAAAAPKPPRRKLPPTLRRSTSTTPVLVTAGSPQATLPPHFTPAISIRSPNLFLTVPTPSSIQPLVLPLNSNPDATDWIQATANEITDYVRDRNHAP
jgi:hypothetical protein